MRDDIVFEELIEKIDLILNSSKPLPYHMKAERKLAEVLRHLQEIPEYDNLKQFEPLFDVESFLIHFLASADYTDLLKIIDRSTMKFKHIDDYTHLMALVVNPNIPFFEKTVVVDIVDGKYFLSQNIIFPPCSITALTIFLDITVLSADNIKDKILSKGISCFCFFSFSITRNPRYNDKKKPLFEISIICLSIISISCYI